jgi:hypothetical protein
MNWLFMSKYLLFILMFYLWNVFCTAVLLFNLNIVDNNLFNVNKNNIIQNELINKIFNINNNWCSLSNKSPYRWYLYQLQIGKFGIIMVVQSMVKVGK